MMIERVHDIGGSEFLAVMEGHPLADLKSPFCGSGLRFPAFRQSRHQIHLVVRLYQQVVKLVTEHLNVGRRIGRGIKAIAGARAIEPEDQMPALLRSLRDSHLRNDAVGHHSRYADGRCAPHEFATVDRSARQNRAELLQITHGYLSLLCLL